MNKNYKQGYKFENELVNKLKSVGFPLVVRTAGSHSVADVIAFGWNEVYIFQCKSTQYTNITNDLVEKTIKNKSVKDLTSLPSRYIKLLAFKAKGNSINEVIFYRWIDDVPCEENNFKYGQWKYIENKLF